MADRTSQRLSHKGLLLQDPRLSADSIWTAESTLARTNEGPIPGLPSDVTDPGPSRLLVEASGTIAADTTAEVRTRRSGMPESGGAGYLYRYAGDGAQDWRAWNPPHVASGFERVVDGAGAFGTAEWPHIVELSDGTLVMAHNRGGDIGVSVKGPVATSWTSQTVRLLDPFGAGRGAHPCLCVGEDDRLFIAYWRQLSSGDCQVEIGTSNDRGTTWYQVTDAALPAAVTYAAAATGASRFDSSTIGRLRMGYYDGEWLLMAHVVSADTDISGSNRPRDRLLQWASSDGAVRFDEVELPDPDDTDNAEVLGGFHDIAVIDGAFLVVWIGAAFNLFTAPFPRGVRLGSAFESYISAGPAYLTASSTSRVQAADLTATSTNTWVLSSDADLAIATSPAGDVWVYHRAIDSGTFTGEGVVLWGGPTGEIGSFEYMSDSSGHGLPGTWWSSEDAATYPHDLAACFHRGSVVLAYNPVSSAGTTDGSLCLLYLGGHGNLTQPGVNEESQDDGNRAGPSLTYLPIDAPADCGWSLATTGSPTLTLDSDGYRIQTGVGATALVSRAHTSTVAEGAWVRAIATPASGSTGSQVLAIRNGDGATDYRVAARITDTTVELYDQVAAAAVGSAAGIDTTDGVELLLIQAGSSARLFARPMTLAGDQLWTRVGETTSLSSHGTPTSDKFIDWGRSVSGITDVKWHVLEVGHDASGVAADFYSDTALLDGYPRSWSSTYSVLPGGLKLRSLDGPGYPYDEHHVAAVYTHGVDQLWTDSPGQAWKPTSGDVLALRHYSSSAAVSPWETGVHGFALFNAAGWTATVEGYDGSTWQSIGTLSTGYTLSGVGDFAGGVLSPSGAANDLRYFRANELAGKWVYIDQSAFFAEMVAQVVSNSEGQWNASAAVKMRMVVDLDNATTIGTTPTSAEITIAEDQAVLVHYDEGTNYSGWRLTWSHLFPSIPDDCDAVGRLVVGPVYLWGQEYSWGRVSETRHNVELTELPDWTRTATRWSEPRRIVDFAWTDGVDTRQVSLDRTTYDYITAHTGGSGVAALGATPGSVDYTVRALQGASTLCVYLPGLPVLASSAAVWTTSESKDAVYGRIVTDVAIEPIQGDERDGEVVNVASVSIEEEL